MPHLLDLQRNSYLWFQEEGLREIFEDISPIESNERGNNQDGKLKLYFDDYKFGEPKYDIAECKERDATFAAPLRVKVRLENAETGELAETEVFMGDFPVMTDTGTFVINGAERVIVSQLVRSPGVYYSGTIDQMGKSLFSSTVIPNRGAWIELESDANDIVHVRIDRNRKLPATVLVRALGFETNDEIMDLFGDDPRIAETLKKDPTRSQEEALIEIYKKLRPGEPPSIDSATSMFNNLFFDPRRYDLAHIGRYKLGKKLGWQGRLFGQTLARPLVHPYTGKVVLPEGTVIGNKELEQIAASEMFADAGSDWARQLEGKKLAEALVDTNTGEVLLEEGTKVGKKELKAIKDSGMFKRMPANDIEAIIEGVLPARRVEKTFAQKRIPGLQEIYVLKGEGDGRHEVKIVCNNANLPDTLRTVEPADMIANISYLLNLMEDIGRVDDIDHLGNRRLRCVGELLQNQFRIGLTRMERVVKERMATQDIDNLTPQMLINIRPVTAALKEFFGSSQLSQFMDQTNPLAELTHKRRLSALGPGGLSRERAGFEVRDVHHSHYGRMCPIETPEGPNIGLISSLANFAKVNKYGLIETPYRVVKHDGDDVTVTSEVRYVTADAEENLVVAQANEPLDENDHFEHAHVASRLQSDVIEVAPQRVDLMDVSPKQVVSVGTALIPFLENDDANRALMGANMQRQAVPLLRTQAPLVGTGMEYTAARDSGVCVLAKRAGTVERVTGKEIIVKTDDGKLDRYDLIKFMRSNQSTCINQIPLVYKGDRVEAGDALADGMATDGGELALGYNVLVAFMPWEGYNYEDAILLSEELCKEDIYTSIHIEEYECDARDTKLGAEEITRQLPNVSEESLKYLDEEGIISIGAEVRPGDVLVGKVTPKGETEQTPEERLLRAIFGDKEREVRDTSLRVPHGESGKIVDVRVFTRENGDELQPGVNKLVRVYIAQKRKIHEGDKMAGRHGNKGVVSRVMRQEDMPFMPDGTPVQIVLNPLGVPSRMNIGQVLETHLGRAVQALGMEIRNNDPDLPRRLKEYGYDVDKYGMPEPDVAGIHIATPVFDGASEVDVFSTLKLANLPEDGKTELFDGRTGEKMDNRVTVGYKYMLKLHHLVDDKIHARSTGPYSLVTQQPLGGKAQFGGQRFGEMEVWALEAYGAAYTLQEILTVKSDDVIGRVKAYEKIVKGENIPEPGVPESFKVLLKELQSIGLDVRILNENGEEVVIRELEEEDLPQAEENELREVMEADAGGQSRVSAETEETDNAPEENEMSVEDTAQQADTANIAAAEPFFTDTDSNDAE